MPGRRGVIRRLPNGRAPPNGGRCKKSSGGGFSDVTSACRSCPEADSQRRLRRRGRRVGRERRGRTSADRHWSGPACRYPAWAALRASWPGGGPTSQPSALPRVNQRSPEPCALSADARRSASSRVMQPITRPRQGRIPCDGALGVRQDAGPTRCSFRLDSIALGRASEAEFRQGWPWLLLLPRCDSDGARARSDGKPRCADIVPMHRMRRVRPSRAFVRREATKIDGFRDASPGRRQQRSNASAHHSGALRRRVETRCRVTPKRSAICSIVRPSA